jgi:hypothetical protein
MDVPDLGKTYHGVEPRWYKVCASGVNPNYRAKPKGTHNFHGEFGVPELPVDGSG